MDRAFSDLSIRMDFWDAIKDLSTAFPKIQQNFKGMPIYTEIVCKLARRMMEAGADIKVFSDVVNSAIDPPLSESYKASIEIRELEIQSLGSNIEFYPHILP